MTSVAYTGLINNVALLLAMSLIYSSIALKIRSEHWPWKLACGFFLGVIGIGVMMNPWQMLPGVVFDARSILLSVGGLFLGAVPVAVALVMTCLFRIYEGGIGAMTGSAVIITSGVLGLLWARIRQQPAHHYTAKEYFLFGIVVHVSMLLWMLSLPHPVGITVLKKISLPVMLIFPAGTVLFAKLLADQEMKLENKQALQESEARHRALVEQSLTGIYAFSGNHFLYVNQRFAEIFGYTEQEVIDNLSPISLIASEDRHFTEKQIERRESGKDKTSHYTVRGRHKDGSLLWVEIHGSQMVIGDETVMAGTLLDITERKLSEEALKESQNRYSTLIDTMSSGFALHEIICSDDGTPKDYRFIEVNDAFEKITGLKRSEVVGRTVLEVLPQTESYWIERFGEVSLTGDPKKFDDYSAELNKHYEVTAYCPKPMQFAAIINDITERKLAEKEIRRLNSDLEERVKERTAQLELSNRELEAFSYSVSHDLRAPLRAINGQAGMLAEALPREMPANIYHHLAAIRSNSSQMGQLVDDLLTYARLTRDIAESETLDMKALVLDCWGEIVPEQEQSRIDFRIGELPPSRGNKAMIKQLVINLLDNAVKYSKNRAQAVIEVGSQAHNGETAYYVRDNGVGFDMRYVNKTFGVFQRLHLEEEFEGTGIGLALAKRIVERHNGRIWAEGEVGKGATFFFNLNTQPPLPAADVAETDSQGSDNAGTK